MEYHPYADSTGLLGDSARLADRLAEDGYVFLRGVLPSADVARVRDQVLAVAAGAGWLCCAKSANPRATGRNAADGALPVVDVEAMARCSASTRRSVLRAMWSRRDFHALLHSPRLLAVLEGLLGEPVFAHPRKVLRFVAPDSSWPGMATYVSGWHQDYPGVQGSSRTLTAWTPLAPITPGSGGMAIVPRSHHAGLLPLRLSAGTIVGWETDIAITTVHSGPMDPGDVLIFTAYTVHGGSPNTGRGPRLSADCRYQPLREPVCRDSIELDDGDSWDAVYSVWPGKGVDDPLTHYWRGLPLDVADYDLRADTARERAAISVGRNHDPAAARALQITAKHSADPAVAAEAAALLRSLG